MFDVFFSSAAVVLLRSAVLVHSLAQRMPTLHSSLPISLPSFTDPVVQRLPLRVFLSGGSSKTFYFEDVVVVLMTRAHRGRARDFFYGQ